MEKVVLFLLIITNFASVFGQELIDFRKFQTPIKNQGERGTCTAFAVAAALEIIDGVPADISEQYLYGALKHSKIEASYYEGDNLNNYINSLQKYGFIHEQNLPYNKKAINWEAKDTEFEKLISGSQIGKVSLLLLKYWAKYSVNNPNEYSYFKFNTIANPEIIKNLLKKGSKAVVVTYSNIHIPTWVNGGFTPKKPINIDKMFVAELGNYMYSYQDALKIYNGDLLADIRAGEIKVALNNPVSINPETGKEISNYGGHAVTIVGYNSKGFIFKNSWGKEWNDKGYGYISYDAHKLMCNEALAFNNVTFQKPKYRSKLSTSTQFILKTTLSENNKLQLSIYTYDMLSDPLISAINYKVYGENSKLIDERTALSPIVGDYDNSFTVNLFDGGKYKIMPPDILFNSKPMKVVIDVYVAGSKIRKTFTFNNVYNMTNEYIDSSYY